MLIDRLAASRRVRFPRGEPVDLADLGLVSQGLGRAGASDSLVITQQQRKNVMGFVNRKRRPDGVVGHGCPLLWLRGL